MNDEFNKGYFQPFGGPKPTYEQQQGADQYFRDQERARQTAEQQQAKARNEAATQTFNPSDPSWSSGSTSYPSGGDGVSSGSATLQSTVSGCAVLGAIAGAFYAFFSKSGAGWPEALGGGIAGAIAGAIVGLPVYGVIIVLRLAVIILAWVLRIAFIGALVLGALYLLGQFLGRP